MSSPREKPARDSDVLAFIAAVFPDAPELARLSFDEGHVLRTATSQLALLRDENARLTKENETLRSLDDLRRASNAHVMDVIRHIVDRRKAAESSCATLEGQIRALEKYAAHQSRCPLSRTYRYQHIMHVENHLDDDGPLDECTSDICRAWGKAGPDGEPDCTCGLSALRRSRETIPPHEQEQKDDH